MDIMKQYPDDYFHLGVVDPPYGIGVNISMGRRKGQKRSDYHKYAGGDKYPPSPAYFKELIRVSKNYIIWGANHYVENIPNANSPCWIVWNKRFSNKVSFASAELACTSFDSVVKMFVYSPNNNKDTRIHPTQKPIPLYAWIYENYAEPGQRIIDTHLGSGSNAIAAHYAKMGKFVGCELDEDYYKASIERIAKETRQLSLF